MTSVMAVSVRRSMCRKARAPTLTGMKSAAKILTRPVWATLITIVMLFTAAFGGSLPFAFLVRREVPLTTLPSALGVTVLALTLVYLYRRFVTGEPWPGVGLRLHSSAVGEALLGVAVGMAAILVTSLVSIALGVAQWRGFDEASLAYLPLSLLIATLNQAFPEEMLFRGHLWHTLSASLSPRTVMIATSLAFGALHIISSSPATGIGERLLYVVSAVALGFACGAARARTGAVWAAAGVHAGLHYGFRIFPLQEIHYDVQLLVQTVSLTLAGLAFLLIRAPRSRPAPVKAG